MAGNLNMKGSKISLQQRSVPSSSNRGPVTGSGYFKVLSCYLPATTMEQQEFFLFQVDQIDSFHFSAR